MRRNPQRLAWAVLLSTFGICVALVIATPLLIRSFINNSAEPAYIILRVLRGNASLQRPNSNDFVLVAEPSTETDIPEGSLIRVDASTQAQLTVRAPSVEQSDLVVIQLADDTNMMLVAASSPLFDASSNPYRVDLFITGGRVRVKVLNDLDRAVAVSIESPQGRVSFSTGTYIVEITNEEMLVTVREGQADVSAHGRAVRIRPSERAIVVFGQPPLGGLSSERNLIIDGNFAEALESSWAVENILQIESESEGSIAISPVNGRRAARFDRAGQNHAETQLVQEINRDVTDSTSLQLHFSVLVNHQDVPVCGSAGSECPLMVRINFHDVDGVEREWLQGFYEMLDPNPDPNAANKPICGTCPLYARNRHRRITADTWFPYDSGNLIDLLNEAGIKPSRIDRITFYASGHSYVSAITDIELLVQD